MGRSGISAAGFGSGGFGRSGSCGVVAEKGEVPAADDRSTTRSARAGAGAAAIQMAPPIAHDLE
jgi:hypothetical protein